MLYFLDVKKKKTAFNWNKTGEKHNGQLLHLIV